MIHPQVEKLNGTRAKKQFNILMGYQYGFCYIPYPSFVPVRYLSVPP